MSSVRRRPISQSAQKQKTLAARSFLKDGANRHRIIHLSFSTLLYSNSSCLQPGDHSLLELFRNSILRAHAEYRLLQGHVMIVACDTIAVPFTIGLCTRAFFFFSHPKSSCLWEHPHQFLNRPKQIIHSLLKQHENSTTQAPLQIRVYDDKLRL